MRQVPRAEELRKVCQPENLDLSLYRKHVIRRLSIHLTRLLLMLGMSANAVSVLKGAVACAGAVLFAPGIPWLALAGAGLLQLSYLLDACDGEVARYTGSCATARGEFLDKLGDAASRGLFHCAWGFGVYLTAGTVAAAMAGAFIGATWLVTRFCALETLLESMSNHPGTPPSQEETEAVGSLFVRGSGGGRVEYLLSLFFHPWVNLATVAALASLHAPAFRWVFWAYALLWAANTARKVALYMRISSFRRPPS